MALGTPAPGSRLIWENLDLSSMLSPAAAHPLREWGHLQEPHHGRGPQGGGSGFCHHFSATLEEAIIKYPHPCPLPLLLPQVAKYAQGFGPWKGSYAVAGPTNYIGKSVDFSIVRNAHAAGLQVHPYTFRNEDRSLAWDWKTDILNEYKFHFNEVGIDGAFTDFPGTLAAFLKRNATGEN